MSSAISQSAGILKQANGASKVGFKQAASSAISRTLLAKLAEMISVLDFGADPNGILDSSAAIQAAIDALPNGGVVIFPTGNYKTDSSIELKSFITLAGSMGAKIKPSNSVATFAYTANNCEGVKLQNLNFIHTGLRYTNGTQRLFQANLCTNMEITGCTFDNGREGGFVFDQCSDVIVSNCVFKNCLGTGATFRNQCARVALTNCIFFNNGNTSLDTDAGGRGVVIWECSSVTISGCTFEDNAEYGLRLYSQTGDINFNRNISITNSTFRNNGTAAAGKIDLYIYDEIGLTERVTVTNCVFSTRTGNTSAALQGIDIVFSNNVLKAISPQTASAMSFFGLKNANIQGNVINGYSVCVGYSGTVGKQPENTTVTNNQFINCVKYTNGVIGNNNVISGNKFTHGGAGTTDLCIDAAQASSSGTIIDSNTFDGFYRVAQLNIDVADVKFTNNVCINTTNLCIRCFGTDLTKLVFHSNVFDLGTNPAELAKLERKGQNSGVTVAHSVVLPSVLAYAKGDLVYNTNPVGGGFVGWICTAAGIGATWKQFGAINA